MHSSDSTLDRVSEPADAPAGATGLTGQAAEQNRVLLALPPEEYAWLSPQLKVVEIAQGQVLAEPDEPFRYVYFPETAVCSVINLMDDGGIIEVGTVGREGMVGLSAFLDAGTQTTRTIGQVPGTASKSSSRSSTRGTRSPRCASSRPTA